MAKNKAKKKATTASASVTAVPPSPKHGPAVTLRMRSQAQIDKVKKAARAAGLSMNTYAVEVLDRAASA